MDDPRRVGDRPFEDHEHASARRQRRPPGEIGVLDRPAPGVGPDRGDQESQAPATAIISTPCRLVARTGEQRGNTEAPEGDRREHPHRAG